MKPKPSKTPTGVAVRIRASLAQAFDSVPPANSKLMKRYGRRSIVVGDKPDNKVDWSF
jgi:hypothetical protein